MNRVLTGLLFSFLALTVLTGQQPPAKRAAAQLTSPNSAQQPGTTPQTRTGLGQVPTPQDFSQEAYVVEHYLTSMRYENDGTGREQVDAKIRIVSESGVQGLGQLKIGYSAASDKLGVVYVRVRKPDGTVVTAQESAIQDLTATPNAPVYTDFHEKVISVPSLRPGDVLEYQIVRTIVSPLAPNQFWASYNFNEMAAVLDEQLEVNVPKARHVKIKTKPGYTPQVIDEGDRRIYRWTHSHQPDGKQQRPPDPNQPPSVQLTTFESWEDVGSWYAFLERERRQPDDAIKAKAAELVQGKSDDMEKVKALYDYVSRNIRYVSLSFGLGRIQPHAASEILANGYGDCKDKNTLLAALLKTQGIESSSVLIGVQRKLDPDVPSPSQFDHMITRVPVGGTDIWLDSTTGVLPFRMLMYQTRDKQALLISPDGKSGLVRTPADLPFQAFDQTKINASLSETGRMTMQISATTRGDREVGLRFALRQIPGNHWKDLFENILQRMGMKGAEISNLQVSDPSDADNPLRISMDASVSNFFDWSARESKIKLPFMQMNLGGEPGFDDDEGAPEKVIRLGAPSDTHIEVQLKVPEKFLMQTPIGVDVRRDYAEYHSNYKLDGQQLTSVRELKQLVRELPYERLQDYEAFQRALNADQAQDIVLENQSPGTAAGAGGDQSAAGLNESGLQALKNNNFQLAVELFQRVVHQEPKHKSAWNNLGRAYLGLNQNEQAIAAFKKQIDINPYDQYAYNNLGVAYEAELKYDDAIGQFHKQIEINPLDPFAHGALGEVYIKQKKFAEALPELEKAVALQPQNPLLLISLGQSYIATNQTEKGMAAFEKAISLAPVPVTWNNIAYSLAEQNVQLERADKYADAAINAVETQLRDVSLDNLRFQDLGTASFLYNVWDTKGWVEFKRGNLDLAEQYVAVAWQASGSGNICEHLGEIYEKRGNRDKAIHYYVLALADTTPSDTARARLTALGASKSLDPMVEQGRRELKQQRTISLNKSGQGTAEFNLLISPSRIEDVKFLKGDDSLKGLAQILQNVPVGMKFPPDASAHVPRRAIVTCGTTQASTKNVGTAKMNATVTMKNKPQTTLGPCTLELRPADSVRTLD